MYTLKDDWVANTNANTPGKQNETGSLVNEDIEWFLN